MAKNTVCDPKHGANRVTGSIKKRGHNKGIAAAKKQQRREDAIFRDSVCHPEDRRQYRLELERKLAELEELHG